MLRGLGEVGRACSLEGFRQFPIVDGDDKSVDFFFLFQDLNISSFWFFKRLKLIPSVNVASEKVGYCLRIQPFERINFS